jgi:hypothetical protein
MTTLSEMFPADDRSEERCPVCENEIAPDEDNDWNHVIRDETGLCTAVQLVCVTRSWRVPCNVWVRAFNVEDAQQIAHGKLLKGFDTADCLIDETPRLEED